MALVNKDLAYDESVLLIANNCWYKRCLTDIPDEYLAYYTAKVRNSGLTVDDLKRIVFGSQHGTNRWPFIGNTHL